MESPLGITQILCNQDFFSSKELESHKGKNS